jgi:hypothetical protein
MIKKNKFKSALKKARTWSSGQPGSMKTVYCLFLIGLFYISSSHFVEKRMREIQSLKHELKELRWEYMAVKSDLMHNSTLSQVAESVVDREGIKSTQVPVRIYVN